MEKIFHFPTQILDLLETDDWRGLVCWLDQHSDFLSIQMQKFVDSMAEHQKPTTKQLAALVGLAANVSFQLAVKEKKWRKAQPTTNAETSNVVDFCNFKMRAS